MTQISIQKEILNKLMDKYEKSKSFSGEGVIERKPALCPIDLFPKYAIDTEHVFCRLVDDSVEVLIA